MSTTPVQKRRRHTEDLIDEAIDESFPASDPPSFSRTAGAGAPPRSARLTKADPPAEETTEDGPEETSP